MVGHKKSLDGEDGNDKVDMKAQNPEAACSKSATSRIERQSETARKDDASAEKADQHLP